MSDTSLVLTSAYPFACIPFNPCCVLVREKRLEELHEFLAVPVVESLPLDGECPFGHLLVVEPVCDHLFKQVAPVFRLCRRFQLRIVEKMKDRLECRANDSRGRFLSGIRRSCEWRQQPGQQ